MLKNMKTVLAGATVASMLVFAPSAFADFSMHTENKTNYPDASGDILYSAVSSDQSFVANVCSSATIAGKHWTGPGQPTDDSSPSTVKLLCNKLKDGVPCNVTLYLGDKDSGAKDCKGGTKIQMTVKDANADEIDAPDSIEFGGKVFPIEHHKDGSTVYMTMGDGK